MGNELQFSPAISPFCLLGWIGFSIKMDKAALVNPIPLDDWYSDESPLNDTMVFRPPQSLNYFAPFLLFVLFSPTLNFD